jgi:protease I
MRPRSEEGEMITNTVACLLGPEFEDSEFQVPYDKLRTAGFRVEIIGTERGIDLRSHKGRVTAIVDRAIDTAKVEDYDLLLIPGGHSPDNLRTDKRFIDFVKAFEQTGKPIAAVCHGPQLLAAAHLVKGRTMTAWKTVQDDLAQMGAHVKDEPVVTDKNWITSRQPSDLELFSSAILRQLGRQQAA